MWKILHHLALLSTGTCESTKFNARIHWFYNSWTALLGLEGWKFIALSFFCDDLHKKKAIILALWMPCHRSSMYPVKRFLQKKSHLFFQGLVSLHGRGSTKFCLWFLSYSSQQPYFRPFPPPLCPAFFLSPQSPLETVIQLFLCTVTLQHSFWWQFTVSFNFHFFITTAFLWSY